MSSDTPGAGSAEQQVDWDALARYLAGESPAAERASVQQWLGSRPDDARMLSALDDALSRLALGPGATAGIDVESALAAVNRRRATPELTVSSSPIRKVEPPRKARVAIPAPSSNRWMRYAAAAALVLIAGTVVWRSKADTANEPTTIAARTFTTPVGGRDSLLLPDGSRVVLGPGSELTLAEGYGQTARNLSVRGDAFFDVVHDDSRPFVVAANNTLIRDIGTAFAVHSDSTGHVRVAVTVGSVEMKPAAGVAGSATVLQAGDIGTATPAGAIVADRGAGSADDVAWTRGKLVFRDTPLAEVRDDLRRWYGVHLDLRDSTLLRRPFSGSFDGDSIDTVLRVIAAASGATFSRRGDTVSMRPIADVSRRK